MFHVDNKSAARAMPPVQDVFSAEMLYFTEEKDQASWPGADWFNIVTLELLNILKLAGVTPEKQRFNQIASALSELMAAQSRIFDNEPEGLLNTSNGQYFGVPQGLDAYSSFIYYKNENGVAVPVSDMVGSAAIKQLNELFSAQIEAINKIIPEIQSYAGITSKQADTSGHTAVQLLDDGTLNLAALLLGNELEFIGDEVSFTVQSRASGAFIARFFSDMSYQVGDVYTYYSSAYPGKNKIVAGSDGKAIYVQYDDGRVEDVRDESEKGQTNPPDGAFSFSHEGNIFLIEDGNKTRQLTNDEFLNLNPQVIKNADGVSYVRFASQQGGDDFVTAVMSTDALNRINQGDNTLIHLFVVGQSLVAGGGTTNQPAITVTPHMPYGAVCFNGGPKYDAKYESKSVAVSDLEQLVPLAENFGKCQMQESACSGMAEVVHEKTGKTVLVSASASSGTSLAGISEGTDAYAATCLMIERGYEIARSIGLTYHPVMIFIHGNADAAGGTSASSYKAQMLSLHAAYEEFIRGLIADTSFTLTVFVQQFANANASSGSTGTVVPVTIAQAQYEVCRDNDAFILSGTQYALEYQDGDHPLNVSYRNDGEVIGHVISAWLNTGNVISLQPDTGHITQTSTEIIVPLSGGVFVPVIDTQRVTDPGNLGWNLEGDAVITAVNLSGNSVRIEKTGTASAVSYAYRGQKGVKPGRFTGSRGCIHDSQTDISTVTNQPIYNDLVVFRYAF
ncbi:TPA: hypothetical protein I8569_003573 [Klebsiella oxytoca]|nr:hypothetical protein [Klebsiella michiganensis]HAT3671811.1 hypothetical protein [Klebsiella oxytoca]